MRARTVVSLAALPILVPPLLAVPAAAAAGERTCAGRTPTIVADGKPRVTGTAGDDVIWARDARQVRAGGGDDLVCLVFSEWKSAELDAGSGDDTVRTSGRASLSVQLGRGSDSLMDSDTEASVDTGDALDAAAGDAPGRDEIRTGAGMDNVTSGAPSTANEDVVRLGGGADVLELAGSFRGTADGGAGDNIVRLADDDHAAWSFDLAAGTATVDGVQLVVSQVDTLDLSNHTWSSLDVAGSPRAEAVLAGSYDRPAEDRGPVTVALKGGNDMVTIGAALETRLGGGPGRDLLDVTSGAGFYEVRGQLVIDLPGASYTLDDGDAQPARSFERVWADRFRVARVTGTDGPDEIDVAACVAELRGRAGNDDLSGYDGNSMLGRGCRDQEVRHVRAVGGAGDDELSGGPFADRLIGGAGRDAASGFGGKDRCSAERESSC